jgi:hypothetical protein
MRRKPLGEFYDALNLTHFGGTLPAYECRRWGPRIKYGCVVNYRKLGYCWPPGRVIRVMGMLPDDQERQVLLHEMCHAATPGDGHGPRWLAEMRRLAAEHGEAWAADAAQQYESGDSEPTRESAG